VTLQSCETACGVAAHETGLPRRSRAGDATGHSSYNVLYFDVMSDDQRDPLRAPADAKHILDWLQETATRLRTEEPATDTLVELLSELRRASEACADASDWLLLAAREQGVSLRQLAPAFGKGYVRAPAARLEKLHRQALDSDQWLEILRSRSADGDQP